MRIGSRGFGMLEALVSGALVIGLGAVVVGLSDNQKKALLGFEDKSELSRSIGRIGEQISDPNTCRVNFLNKNIETPLRMTELTDRNSAVIVKEGERFEKGNYVAKEIFIKDYDTLKNRVQLRVLFERTGEGAASKSINKYFNFYAKVAANKITECLDPIEQTAFGSMMKSCYDADPALNGVCEENFKNLLGEVKRIYCTGHPILEYDSGSEKCKVLDGGKVCPGGYIQGFSATGALECYPGPSRPVPPPDRISLPCSAWTAWAPSPATVCSGVQLTQNRSCPLSGATESQVVYGTKTDGACAPPCSDPRSAWAPDSASVCAGLSLVQSRSRTCPSGPQTESQTVTGTSTDPSCLPCSGTWAPDPSTVCLGVSFTQSRVCPDGSVQTQSLTGIDGSASCCKSWGNWTPSADTVCCEGNVTQSRTCLDAGSTATQTQTVSGTKTSGSCGGTWTPSDLSGTCSDAKVTQTNSCGITREVAGGKTCGCIFYRPFMWNDRGLQCAEYFKAAGSPMTEADKMIIPEGETHTMSAGYCSGTGSGKGCWGSASVTCTNGTHVYGSSFCQEGYEP